MFQTIKKYILSLSVLAALGACSHDELEQVNKAQAFRPAGDFIRNNYDLSLTYAAMQRAGITEALNGKGPFTVLAPGNTAWNRIGIMRAEDFQRLDADSLRNMLNYHVINRRLLLAEIPVNGIDVRYATLYDNKELFTTFATHQQGYPQYPQNHLFFNGSYCTKKEVTLANGTLYVLDKVIKYNPGTVQDWLSKRPEYSLFVAGLKKFGLWERLAQAGPFTVFAPENAAFEAAGLDLATLNAMNADAYIGARLFGVYIVPRSHYFIGDFLAFNTIYGTGGFTAKIEGDTHNRAIRADRINVQGDVTYTLSVFTPNDPWSPIGGAMGTVAARSDFQTDNGLVHNLPQLLIKPDQARKNQ
ncbi:fasciclin domain-containing protein [Chitinophaga caseinilytica]|uniref:fasciclin domain-containing protein n=1 Tax=Chitinophaga caseinilytica TaxID=2267521 RepID=UPI003C2ABE8B